LRPRHPTFRESLGPLAARLPAVVREHEVLRIHATLVGTDRDSCADAARRDVLKWAEKRCGGRLPREAWDFDSFEYFSGGRDSLGVRLKSDAFDFWAVRAMLISSL